MSPPRTPDDRIPSRGGGSPVALLWQPNPPRSPKGALARLSGRPLRKHVLALVLCLVVGLYLTGTVTITVAEEATVVAAGLNGASGTRWMPAAWRVRRKASEGLIKKGGRVAKNESYKSQSERDR